MVNNICCWCPLFQKFRRFYKDDPPNLIFLMSVDKQYLESQLKYRFDGQEHLQKPRGGGIQCDIRGAIMKMFSRFIFMTIHCIGLLILSNSLVYQRNGRDTLKPFSPDVVDLHNNFNHMFCVTETLPSTAIYYLLVGVFPPNQHVYIYYFLFI